MEKLKRIARLVEKPEPIAHLEFATRSLARLRDPRDIHFFTQMALDWRLSREVRRLALDTIRAIGGKKCRDALASIARKSDDWVGTVAKEFCAGTRIRDDLESFGPFAERRLATA